MRTMRTFATVSAIAASVAVGIVADRQAAQVYAQEPATSSVPIDPSLFGGLKWRSIGPARGGRSQAAAGSASRPLEYYFGATGGGLWKTTDGGLTWRPVSDASFNTSSVGAVAVSESNPDVVYVGMGETQLRGNIMQGDGLYKIQRRRENLYAYRSREDARDLPHPRASFQRRRRLRCRAWRSVRAQRRIAASSSRSTAERRGTRCCSATIRPAPSICRWTRRIPTCSTPDSGRCSARRTRCRAAAPAADCSKPPMAA